MATTRTCDACGKVLGVNENTFSWTYYPSGRKATKDICAPCQLKLNKLLGAFFGGPQTITSERMEGPGND